jgi:Domain of unknown function (DUF397)
MEQNSAPQEWVKSSFSAAGNCVEVMQIGNGTCVRNSREPAGGILVFTAEEWSAFIGGAKLGEFDRFAAR